MSLPGRPKGEYPRAQHEGTAVTSVFRTSTSDGQPQAAPLKLDGSAAQVPYGRAFTTLAGICPGASEAQAVARQLTQAFGLAPTQVSVMGPAEGGWLRFRLRARQWAQGADAEGRSWFDDRSLMALLGGVAAVGTVFAWLALDEAALNGAAMLFLLLLTLGLTLVCVYMAVLGRQQPQYRRFDRKLRRELARGRWVVLLHDVPPLRQEGLVSFVCSRSQRWCAVSPAPGWL